MTRQLRFFAMVMLSVAALTASAFTALAATSEWQRADSRLPAPLQSDAAAPNAACTAMAAGDVAWVTLNDEGDIDEQVDAYPGGTSLIVPVFEYACVPKKVTIVSVFSFEGEQVYSDKEPLKASNTQGLYGYPLGTTDESPLDEGEWGVEFFNNKTLLTSGSIVVGDESGTSETVNVVGTVKDAKTKKAIKGAVILVLLPGVTIQDFIDNDQQDEDIYTGAKTDSKGQYELESPLEREVEYSIIVVAKGYKPIGQDGLVIPADAEDPVELPITMTK